MATPFLTALPPIQTFPQDVSTSLSQGKWVFISTGQDNLSEDTLPSLLPAPEQALGVAASSQPSEEQIKEAKRIATHWTAGLSSKTGGLKAHRMRMIKQGKGKAKSTGKSGQSTVKDLQIISKTYDPAGRMPSPSNGLNLGQYIRVELTQTTSSFLASAGTTGVFTGNALVTTLSLFNAATSLTNVFDQYKFEQIEVWLYPKNPKYNSNVPQLLTCVDLDDSNVPTSAGQISDKYGSLVGSGLEGHYHKWLPHMAIAAFSGAFTSYSNQRADWIDCASPGVQHYGIKAGVVSPGAVLLFDLVYRAVISFRSAAIQ